MALKLSYTASETLNDLVLHTLQNEGLEKAEAVEQAFYAAFEQMKASPTHAGEMRENALLSDVKTAIIHTDFIAAYQTMADEVLVLDICHISRYANVLNRS
jgi:plasmid stabilization system protein ParE